MTCNFGGITAIDGLNELYSVCGGMNSSWTSPPEIPDFLGFMTDLTSLSLPNVGFVGSIPSSINELYGLKYIDLSGNNFHSLPRIASLVLLEELHMEGNFLEILPQGIDQLSSLRVLDIAWNEVTELPENLGYLEKMERLLVSGNQLQNLPESIGKLTQLEELQCDANAIKSLPASIGDLRNLRILNISDNPLETLGDSVGQLAALTTLLLAENQLQTLPESFGDLSRLESLDLDENHLVSLPESFGQLGRLSFLRLGRNQLTTLPSTFGGLTELETLVAVSNQLLSLPESFGGLTRLSALYLTSNLGLARLPESFGGLTNLTVAMLNDCNLETLPSSLGQLTMLESLHLQSNRLKMLPESIGGLQSLHALYVDRNQLETLPDTIGALEMLTRLSLSTNLLPYLPNGICNCNELIEFSVASNQLRALPECLGRLENLRLAYLQNNLIESLPESFWFQSWLEYLDVSNNLLTTLPTVFSGASMTINLLGNTFACDLQSLSWMEMNMNLTLENVDTVQCSAVNEFAGFPIHRVRFLQEEPATHPTIDEESSVALTSSDVFLEWSFDPQAPNSTETIEWNGTRAFDCDGIEPSNHRVETPWLLFQVEWRVAGDLTSSWPNFCVDGNMTSVPHLQPNLEYDFRVRALHVRWDVPRTLEDEVILFAPRFSFGPRSLTIRIQTFPDKPGGAPRNLNIAQEQTKETSVTLEWDPPAQPNSDNLTYTVKVNEDTIVAQQLRSTNLVVDGLQPGTEHVFRVQAWSQVGPGEWSDPFFARTQDVCPLGSQRMENAGYTCQRCPLDTFRSELNSNQCLKCPSINPHTLSVGASSEENCTDGSVYLEGLEPNDMRRIRRGFWRISNTTMDFRECVREEYCQPSQRHASWVWESSDQYCSAYHTGILCSQCESWFALKASGCELCDEETTAHDRHMLSLWIIIGILLAFVPTGILLFHVLWKKDKNKRGTEDESDKSSSCCGDFQVLAEMAVSLRVLLGFFQVFLQYVAATGLTSSSLSSGSSGGLRLIVDLNVAAFLRGLRTGCVWETDFYDSLMLYTLFPIVSIALMFAVLFLSKPCTTRFASAFGLAVWTTLQLLFLVYPGVSSAIFETFRYDEFPKWEGDSEPNRTLWSDHTIDFDSSKSKGWRAYASVMIVVYPIGVVVVFWRMVLLGKQLEAKNSDVQNAVRASVAFLSRPYEWAYFECYELLRKLLLTSGFLLVQQETRGGAEVFFHVMTTLFLIVLLSVRPYKSKSIFVFASISSILLVATGLIPMAVSKLDDRTSPSTTASLALCVAVLECVAFGANIIWLAYQYRIHPKEKSSQDHRQQHHHHQQQQQNEHDFSLQLN